MRVFLLRLRIEAKGVFADMKKRMWLFEALGALCSFCPPVAAALIEFPYHARVGSLLDALRLSAAAFSVVAVVGILTLWRTLSRRLCLPKSGFVPALFLLLVAYGVEQYIHALVVVLFYAALGALVAAVFYYLADREARHV